MREQKTEREKTKRDGDNKEVLHSKLQDILRGQIKAIVLSNLKCLSMEGDFKVLLKLLRYFGMHSAEERHFGVQSLKDRTMRVLCSCYKIKTLFFFVNKGKDSIIHLETVTYLDSLTQT